MGPRGLGDGITPNAATPLPTGKASGTKKVSADGKVQSAYVRQAMQADEVNLQAVEEARKLLESGAMDTPEAAAKTAEAMMKLGT